MNLESDRDSSFTRRNLGKVACLWLLLGVTVFGFLVAGWTPSGRLPYVDVPSWVINLAAHFVVLGLWTFSWLLVWKQVLARFGGLRLALAVSLLAAAAAEVIQAWLPGHTPDLLGFAYNLLAVATVYLFWRKRIDH